MPKCPVRDAGDFAIWYSPGVAAPCRKIQAHPELVYEYTNKANCIAIVSDGTRVLGLGDIGNDQSGTFLPWRCLQVDDRSYPHRGRLNDGRGAAEDHAPV